MYKRQVHTTLARDLGVDPGPELRAAHGTLRGSPARSPEIRVIPAQLPRDLPRFTGRRTELDRLEALLPADGRAMPVIAIDGLPGAGKSALAVHWAHRIAGRFPDGQIYLDLREEGPDEALRSVLSALGVAGRDVPDGAGARAGLYRSLVAGRRMIVLLDNAADAGQVRQLLPGGAESLVVTTARTRMTELAAALLRLGPLTADEAHDLLVRRLTAALGDRDWPALRMCIRDR